MKNVIRKEKEVYPLRIGYTSANDEHRLSYNDKGLLHGKQTIYRNGKRDLMSKYNNGKKMFNISFYKNGNVASKAIYKDSICILHKTYQPCGEPYLFQKWITWRT